MLLAVAILLWRIAVRVRDASRGRWWRAAAMGFLDIVALLALYSVWFEAGWGWNYDRAPIETRVAYDGSRVTPLAVDALRSRAITEMNALAPGAHARAREPLDLLALRAAWLPVVQRAGDTWTPQVGGAKATLAGPIMDLNGTSGFVNPLSLTVQLAPDLLWFERPFDLAHEWSHLAAYAREDEANYIAALTCLRSRDPVAEYSGWLELFLALPPLQHYARTTFTPLVWSDFAALRERNARHINLSFAAFSWRTYNTYLKSNRIASGTESYDEVTRLLLGVPLDRQGLPITART